MEYSPPGGGDPACVTGNGNITEVTAEVCRTNPINNEYDVEDGIEASCLFPFTLNGVRYDTCIMDELEDFTRPVFRCPIRTVRGAGPNGTDYTDFHLTGTGELGETGGSPGSQTLQGEFCPTN